MKRPLDGIRVLDLSRVLSGPFCSMWLADLGAEVVKVEHPQGGDDTRAFGPPFLEGESAYFMSVNRGKKSLTLDMKRDEARDILWRLVEQSDVLLENFRPGTLERLGFSGEALLARNPKIIVASISGYGSAGLAEYVEKPGYDLVVQGLSGLASLTGAAEGPPFKLGVSIADLNAGMLALVGILSALFVRERTGRGQLVDVSMLDGTVSLLTFQAGIYFASGRVPRRMGNAHPTICPYETFEAADGFFNLGCGNDSLWRSFCEATGRLDWAEDPELATNSGRVRNRERLLPALTALFKTKPVSAWVELLERAGVPCGPILGVDGALSHPQLRARHMVVEMKHPRAGTVTTLGTPIRFSETPASPSMPPPMLGEHSDEVLRDLLGLDAEEIARLHASGVI
jgi:crotonobetainyl-CoA:carnitine CoA-transferase CaiB-like acyl-CoA transferase